MSAACPRMWTLRYKGLLGRCQRSPVATMQIYRRPRRAILDGRAAAAFARRARAGTHSHQEARRLFRAVPGARELCVRCLASHRARGTGALGRLLNDAQITGAAAALFTLREEGCGSRSCREAEAARRMELPRFRGQVVVLVPNSRHGLFAATADIVARDKRATHHGGYGRLRDFDRVVGLVRVHAKRARCDSAGSQPADDLYVGQSR
jgi:hypothetical protein